MTKDEAWRVSEQCGQMSRAAAEHLNAREEEDSSFWIAEFSFWRRQAQLYAILAGEDLS